MKKIERALISVSDKKGVVDFARALAGMGVELLSTGGTAKTLREAGLSVLDVSEFTGFPEMLDGRVKTLHPKVHAGLLYVRGEPSHEKTMQEHQLRAIDLVCVNLYPFEATVAKPGVTFEDAVEQIDIGGPAMLRSAAKNMRSVTVVTDPADYARVLDSMNENNGDTTPELRVALAQKVYARVAEYNAAIARYLADHVQSEQEASRPFVLAYSRGTPLRYGENPHQDAVCYVDTHGSEASIAHTEQLHGKELSYNNYVDGDAALEAVKELSGAPGVAVIKHTNPCGYATGETLAEAFEAAWRGDTVSAFGSVIAVTQPVDIQTAELLKGRFVEVLIAPDYAPDALEYLQSKSKDLRLLKLKHPMTQPGTGGGVSIRQMGGGLLVQDRDVALTENWFTPTERAFPDDKQKLAEFGVKACKHVKSNAIVLVREYRPGNYAVLGMGAGQPNRIDSLRKLALTKACENIEALYKQENVYGKSPQEFQSQVLSEVVLISDAFFPFADTVEIAAQSGIKYIVQPGGSKRDEEVVAACDQYGIAMTFTGMRHFRH
jgi:phosphoribosylaminoimidazolecarboxamide formyltransferase / IMP cyclohydrolase